MVLYGQCFQNTFCVDTVSYAMTLANHNRCCEALKEQRLKKLIISDRDRMRVENNLFSSFIFVCF